MSDAGAKGERRGFYRRRIDADTQVSWIGEMIFLRYKGVVVVVDTWWRHLSFWINAGASDEDVAMALERLRKDLPRPDTVPTVRLSRVS